MCMKTIYPFTALAFLIAMFFVSCSEDVDVVTESDNVSLSVSEIGHIQWN